MIMFGGFVKLWGYDHSFTLQHYAQAFGITTGPHGLLWTGSAWNSFWTTLQIAIVSAPLTAGVGLLTAWILVRQQFVGKDTFEFGTMLSFAIPGTVIGVSYILAFNVPPIEITGTGVILVICFVFRNMPVGGARRCRGHVPDPPRPRRGLAHARREQPRHAAARGAAAAPSGGDRRPRVSASCAR